MAIEFKLLLLLLNLKAMEMLGNLRSLKPSRLLSFTVSGVIAAVIAFLVYRFDLFVFSYLMGVPELGRLVIARFFEIAFLVFFLVLMISTALTALSMLYREDELSLLLTLPVSSATIFTVKYFEVILFSSWALVALAVPFILSYAVYFKINFSAYFTIFAGLMLPLVLISGSVGVVGALLIRLLLGGKSRRWLFKWSAIVLLIIVLTATALKLSGTRVSEKGLAYLISLLEDSQTDQNSLLPHKLISRGFLSILEDRWDQLQRVVLTLLGMAALVVLLTLDLGKVLYYRSWLKGSDRAPTKGRSSALLKISFWTLKRWISPVYRALFRKDILEFRRYPLQWGQSFLLLGFWAMYVVNFVNIPHYFNIDGYFWKMIFYYGNFCFACFFTAALAGRFVFPIISLEGQAFWLLKTAPLAMESFLWSKFWQAFLPLIFLSSSMVIIGNLVLGVDTGLQQVSLLSIIIITISLTSVSLGLGAIFADFSQRNPMKIANTPGGILCIFISLTFVVLLTTVFAWPAYLHYKFTTFQGIFPLNEWITAIIIYIALGVVATLLPLKLGLKALNSDLKV
ncbi:hypothetical protein CEE37_12965 [candidate division LCP-89 bacterium B3_LCP]|uniref:Uncharacterized protein n=1 Tax=candidate division LCP-89 bacterium B3_LCP TaxID=2012998 RepID=A0A532UU09_UNCL8|nr:MAG: hypothetical protein CEE37_12965 [candidate division LCP-89 bacterium B3_LCP]